MMGHRTKRIIVRVTCIWQPGWPCAIANDVCVCVYLVNWKQSLKEITLSKRLWELTNLKMKFIFNGFKKLRFQFKDLNRKQIYDRIIGS